MFDTVDPSSRRRAARPVPPPLAIFHFHIPALTGRGVQVRLRERLRACSGVVIKAIDLDRRCVALGSREGQELRLRGLLAEIGFPPADRLPSTH